MWIGKSNNNNNKIDWMNDKDEIILMVEVNEMPKKIINEGWNNEQLNYL